ncbi:MAG TPA: DUF748 domain-containing protein, partial [Polyangia bacterium]|nr:DUF748 domain-containing protein [Polyangia bacterium]
AIAEPDGVTPFLGFSRLYVNAEASSLVRRAPVIKEIALQALRVHVVRERVTEASWGDVEAAYNFSDILARLAAPPKSPQPQPEPPRASAEPPRFSLNNIHIDDAAVVFDDAPTGDHHEITGLSAGVPFASTLPVYLDTFVQPGLRVWVDGTPFVISGRTKPFKQSLETVLELRLQALDLTRYVPFVPMRLPFALRSAELSLALDVTFVRPADEAPKVTVKGDVALEKIDVEQKQGKGTRPLLALERLAITLGESDVSAPSFHVEKVLASGLDVHLRKQRDGTLNVQHLAPAAPAAPGSPAPPAPPAPAQARESASGGLRFAVDAFDLEKTTLHFRDDSVAPAFETEVRDVSVAVHDLSNAHGATAKVEASLRAVPGGNVHQRGTLRLAPLGAEGKLTVDDVEPGRFAPYTRDLVAFDVASGRVRLGADYRFEARERGQPASLKLHDAFVEIANLALRRRGTRDDFFKLAALTVQGASLDLGERKVEVASIATHDGRVRAARDANGEIDLATLVPPAPPAPPAAAKPAAAVAPSWTVTVARFDLDRWSARFDDHAVSTPTTITLDQIALHLTGVSTAPGARLGVDLRLGINKTGKLQVGGNATLPPVAANLRFDLKGLEVLPLQPYFQNQESLLVTGGTVALRGQAAVKIPATGDPKLDVTADIDVGDLTTVDRAKHEPLLKWRSFHVGGLHVVSPPMSVAIEDVALTDFQSRLVLSADAHFNLQDALAAPGATAAPPPAATAPAPRKTADTAPAPAPMPVTIGQVTLQGGQVTFTDRSVHPSYTADLTELAGRISGLSSTPGTTAAVDIRGSVNRSGVLTIVGSANPLAKDLSLDVQVNLRDFELPPASPYTGRYAGYVISKGKLDLSLAYKIAAGKLDARNKLVLDQFTFGEKVESPDATKLPVRLAVALLKDRRGVIDIDLPIAGSLADPQFRIWRAVLKVLRNLLVKAATAPFALIASAFGGGEELSHVEFPAGRATLDEGAQKRLGVLAKALRERPGISFEIQGGADPGQDREGLRRFLYERKLKAAKLAALVQTGAAVPSLDDLTLDAAERPALVAAVYKTEKFPKPKNALGFEKSLHVEEQEKLMLVNTRVEDDELRALALRRATAVQALLAKSVPGGASRLFLVTPRLTAANVQLDLKKD